jgi:hypothetical protein
LINNYIGYKKVYSYHTVCRLNATSEFHTKFQFRWGVQNLKKQTKFLVNFRIHEMIVSEQGGTGTILLVVLDVTKSTHFIDFKSYNIQYSHWT